MTDGRPVAYVMMTYEVEDYDCLFSSPGLHLVIAAALVLPILIILLIKTAARLKPERRSCRRSTY